MSCLSTLRVRVRPRLCSGVSAAICTELWGDLDLRPALALSPPRPMAASLAPKHRYKTKWEAYESLGPPGVGLVADEFLLRGGLLADGRGGRHQFHRTSREQEAIAHSSSAAHRPASGATGAPQEKTRLKMCHRLRSRALVRATSRPLKEEAVRYAAASSLQQWMGGASALAFVACMYGFGPFIVRRFGPFIVATLRAASVVLVGGFMSASGASARDWATDPHHREVMEQAGSARGKVEYRLRRRISCSDKLDWRLPRAIAISKNRSRLLTLHVPASHAVFNC